MYRKVPIIITEGKELYQLWHQWHYWNCFKSKYDYIILVRIKTWITLLITGFWKHVHVFVHETSLFSNFWVPNVVIFTNRHFHIEISQYRTAKMPKTMKGTFGKLVIIFKITKASVFLLITLKCVIREWIFRWFSNHNWFY